jgi:hypothetical protein
MRRMPTTLAMLAAALAVTVPLSGTAVAHVEDPHEPESPLEEPPPQEPAPPEEHPDVPMEHDGEGDEDEMVPGPSTLELMTPGSTTPGDPTRFEAVLTDAHGGPVVGARIEFLTEVAWGDRRTEVVAATAVTDDDGRAVADVDLRAAGEARVVARFAGDERFAAAADEAVVAVADVQVVRPEVGIEVPFLTVWWLLGLVALVWLLFLVVGVRTALIARSAGDDAAALDPDGADLERRGFLGRFLVPVGLVSVVASLGWGLLALIVRSPRTHGNLGAVADHAEAGHRFAPIARLGGHSGLDPLPPLLDREVSFIGEVLPILRAKGGPHAHAPKHSPPPHRVRLDSYEHIMETPGLVVPGHPGDSRIVQVLLDPAVRMPPSMPPLPEGEIQVIASWVSQGARNN